MIQSRLYPLRSGVVGLSLVFPRLLDYGTDPFGDRWGYKELQTIK